MEDSVFLDQKQSRAGDTDHSIGKRRGLEDEKVAPVFLWIKEQLRDLVLAIVNFSAKTPLLFAVP
ncbi:hypothetical protein MJO28_008897 [Puccinia striiformis f. sp. tritici]|uniref:Uncharacterized protein n=1 Tax=Puccinia striiformis f. sp. tritici TaxID=168172 RepID=A0ACC0EDZ2_9BASI|nr:hypothetical protein MJO28_008897 [Puccinia striiformis f. sp. tritici]